jgi:hypothetical protein
MSTIVTARSVSVFFGEVVEDAIKAKRVDATDGATHYLVSLLADYAHPDHRDCLVVGRGPSPAGEALDRRPLTLLLDEALRVADAADRFERLRTLGDSVLYGCGFFADHFEARGVDPKYLHGIGTRAYGAASTMLRRGPSGPSDESPDLFRELAEKFEAFVDVVAEVADATIAMSAENCSAMPEPFGHAGNSRGLLKAYERWLKTGSGRLASALASLGVVPTRGAKGGVLQ